MIVANPYLMNVAPYKPGATAEQIRFHYGLDQVEKLASNENPFGSQTSCARMHTRH